MTRITVEINDEWLHDAGQVLGTKTKVATINEALRLQALRAQAAEIIAGRHRQLAARSQHRNFRLPDLIIAATAEMHGATVLHYHEDYDRIAEITGQPTEWVAPRGSL